MENILQNSYSVERYFQYDYIYFDLIFLLIWIGFLLYKKEYKAILFGFIISPIIYFIDAYVWWTNKVNNIFIREYFINNVQIINNGYDSSLIKFGTDFMMTISYSLFNFVWIWLVFNNFDKCKKMLNKETMLYTFLWFTFWMLVPLLSKLISIDDSIVHSVRHMESQNLTWAYITAISYGLLIIFSKYNYKLTLKLFLIGMVAAFIMEFPLFFYNIRPNIDLSVFMFDTLFMINQSIPLLYFIFKICNKKEICKIYARDKRI